MMMILSSSECFFFKSLAPRYYMLTGEGIETCIHRQKLYYCSCFSCFVFVFLVAVVVVDDDFVLFFMFYKIASASVLSVY